MAHPHDGVVLRSSGHRTDRRGFGPTVTRHSSCSQHHDAKNAVEPSFSRDQFNAVRAMLGQEALGIAQIAKDTGLSRQTIYRIKDDPAGSEASLAAWGM